MAKGLSISVDELLNGDEPKAPDLIGYSNKTTPYGKWTCADGRTVLFNRGYRPIWQKVEGEVMPHGGAEHIPYVKEEHFWDDSTPHPMRAKLGDAALTELLLRRTVPPHLH